MAIEWIGGLTLQEETPKPDGVSYCLHLSAGRGRNRKPRNMFLIFSPSGHLLAVVGDASQVADTSKSLGYKHCQGLTSMFRITLDEYRRLLRLRQSGKVSGSIEEVS